MIDNLLYSAAATNISSFMCILFIDIYVESYWHQTLQLWQHVHLLFRVWMPLWVRNKWNYLVFDLLLLIIAAVLLSWGRDIRKFKRKKWSVAVCVGWTPTILHCAENDFSIDQQRQKLYQIVLDWMLVQKKEQSVLVH